MNQQSSDSTARKKATQFVILMGVVSLFADMTYEGARSITGPYLSLLGASATVVGFAAGLGELIGYALRIISGYLTDKTKRYWTITITGYAVNLVAVPLFALAGRWEIAVALMMAERMGKAIRAPARDVILSNATKEIGVGWGFGLHEALDQVGAILGPTIISVILAFKGQYQMGFAVLAIPAVLALGILLRARQIYPHPEQVKKVSIRLEGKGFSRIFWIYLAAVALVAAGYADFPLMAYHLKKMNITADYWVPIFYAIAMAVDGVAALAFGIIFDRKGIPVMVAAVVFSLLFAPCVFFGDFKWVLAGVVFWGIGMGAQESIMRAAVAMLVPIDKRGTAYGVFNTGYGIFWFLGSALMGVLYDRSIPALVVFSVVMQIASIPLFLLCRQKNASTD